MRKHHRVALRKTVFAFALAGITAAITVAVLSSAPSKEVAPSESSALAVSRQTILTLPAPSDQDSMMAVRAQFTSYVTTTLTQEAATLRTFAAAEARQRQLRASATTSSTTPAPATSGGEVPAAWIPTATCEEGGRNDPYAGYFGILEWNHFDGYPTAGSAPVNVQLDWEAAHGQGPPDAPGECHGY